MQSHFRALIDAAIEPDLRLRQFELADAEIVFALIDRDRNHLRRWLPWVDITLAPTNARNFIAMTLEQAKNRNGFHCAIEWNGDFVGTVGLHSVDWPNRKTSIGYWLGSAFTGRGIMTRAVERVIDHCFEELKLHRVEIRCAVENGKSRAIPARLGFIEEGVLKESEWLGDHYVDHVVYGITAPQWRKII